MSPSIPAPRDRNDRGWLLAVGLASGASLVDELALTRLLSVTTWYHFAFAVISMALLGLGFGSTLVGSLPSRFRPAHERIHFGWVTLAAAVASMVTLAVVLQGRLEAPIVASALLRDLGFLVATILPFAAMGMALALALRAVPDRPGLVYGADLLGAAVGAAAFVPLAHAVGAPGSMLVAALAFAAAAALVGGGRRVRAAAAAFALLCLAGLVLGRTTPLFRPAWAKGQPAPRTDEAYWNAYSYITVTDAHRGEPFGWGFGSQRPHHKDRVRQLAIQIDGGAMTVITKLEAPIETYAYLHDDVTNAVYALKTKPSVFVIGLGGGRDVLSALVAGSPAVTAVELNDRMLDLVEKVHARDAGIAGRPEVRLVQDEGRSFLTRSHERYDVIQASLIDTFAAASSGAFALSENSLYTLDAWAIFLDHLNPDGVLTVSRWSGDTQRLVSLAVAALARHGVSEPSSHVALLSTQSLVRRQKVEGSGIVTILVKPEPFTESEIAALRAECARAGYQPLYLPDGTGRPSYRPLGEGAAAWWNLVRSETDRDIGAPADDRPFFFYRTPPGEWLQPGTFLRMPGLLKAAHETYLDPRDVLVAILFAAAGAALFLLVLPPLVALRRDPAAAPRALALAYMALVGLAFMFVEVPLLTRLAIVLGHPVLSLVVVLSGLLVASGIGSLVSSGRSRAGRTWVLALVPVLVVALALSADRLAAAMTALPGAGRLIGCAAIVLVLGFPMGFALPSGLAAAARPDGRGAPILFGVNGAFSVLGSVIAMVVLLNTGVRATLLAGAVLYVAAALLLPWLRSRPDPPASAAPANLRP